MEQQPFIERRDSPRSKRIVTVKHRLHKRRGQIMKVMWMLSTTENMSASGLLFNSALEYKRGDILEIQVVMSGVLDLFNGYGQVVRVDEGRGKFLVAVKYVSLKARRRPAKKIFEFGQQGLFK